MCVDWVSRVTWFYNVLWPSSLYFSICHELILVGCITWAGGVHSFIYLPKHRSRYIISAHRQNRWQQTNSCTNKDIFLLHLSINIILQPNTIQESSYFVRRSLTPQFLAKNSLRQSLSLLMRHMLRPTRRSNISSNVAVTIRSHAPLGQTPVAF